MRNVMAIDRGDLTVIRIQKGGSSGARGGWNGMGKRMRYEYDMTTTRRDASGMDTECRLEMRCGAQWATTTTTKAKGIEGMDG